MLIQLIHHQHILLKSGRFIMHHNRLSQRDSKVSLLAQHYILNFILQFPKRLTQFINLYFKNKWKVQFKWTEWNSTDSFNIFQWNFIFNYSLSLKLQYTLFFLINPLTNIERRTKSFQFILWKFSYASWYQ